VSRAAPTSTVSYGPHPEQVADLWLPAGEGPHPAVVLVHGGCWRAQYGRDLENRVAADLVARGMAVLNVEYRRLDCGGDWPAPLEDVVAAATALPDEIDGERVALAGHSAGGHLALLSASRLKVRGVLAQAPLSDLPLAAELGCCPGAVERLLAQGAPSPIDEPPDIELLLVHGDSDEHVSVELSRRYANGGHAVYVELVGCGHMEHLDPTSDAGQLAGNWLERLLVRAPPSAS
jgi:pimeloyl-ACP methyl ester carboxylesterase